MKMHDVVLRIAGDPIEALKVVRKPPPVQRVRSIGE